MQGVRSHFAQLSEIHHGVSNPISDSSGRLVDVEPTAIPSVIHSPESHPIEIRIRQILNSGTGVNFRVAHKLFDLVEKEPAARGDHDESFPIYFLE